LKKLVQLAHFFASYFKPFKSKNVTFFILV
jgi:hypothetical protein